MPEYQKEDRLSPLFDELKTLPVYQKEDKLVPLFSDLPYIMLEVSQLQPLFQHLNTMPEYQIEKTKLTPLFEELKKLPGLFFVFILKLKNTHQAQFQQTFQVHCYIWSTVSAHTL